MGVNIFIRTSILYYLLIMIWYQATMLWYAYWCMYIHVSEIACIMVQWQLTRILMYPTHVHMHTIYIQCHLNFSVMKLFQSVVLRKQAMHAYRVKSKIKSILKKDDKANCINMTIYIDNSIVKTLNSCGKFVISHMHKCCMYYNCYW